MISRTFDLRVYWLWLHAIVQPDRKQWAVVVLLGRVELPGAVAVLKGAARAYLGRQRAAVRLVRRGRCDGRLIQCGGGSLPRVCGVCDVGACVGCVGSIP